MVLEVDRFAFALEDVLEVTLAATLVRSSGSDAARIGYLDLRGDVLPVFGARELLAMPPRPLGLADRFVIVRVGTGRAAIVVDRVEGVETIDLVTGPDPDRGDGRTLGRRADAMDGEDLVALLDVGRLLGPAAGATDEAATA